MTEEMQERKQKILEKMFKIKHRIAIISGKGGVGKSTMSSNIAYGLSQWGYIVGILDAAWDGPNIPKISEPLKITENLSISSLSFFIPNDDPVIWRGPQKMGAIMELLEGIEWDDIDFLIVDLPPGTGDETLTIAQNIGPNAKSIIVTTPQNVSLLDSKRSVKFAKLINLKVLGIIENMSGFICDGCHKEVNIFKKGGAKKMAEDTGTKFLGSVPLDSNVVESCDNGTPFISNDSVASRNLNNIITEILSELEK